MSQETMFIKGTGSMLQVLQGDSKAVAAQLGSEFQIIEATMTDGAGEKHVPVVEQQGTTVIVKVGSVSHPMLAEHSIQWVYLVTKKGGQMVNLLPDEEPTATFILAPGEEAVTVYAYCNIHGLWETTLK